MNFPEKNRKAIYGTLTLLCVSLLGFGSCQLVKNNSSSENRERSAEEIRKKTPIETKNKENHKEKEKTKFFTESEKVLPKNKKKHATLESMYSRIGEYYGNTDHAGQFPFISSSEFQEIANVTQLANEKNKKQENIPRFPAGDPIKEQPFPPTGNLVPPVDLEPELPVIPPVSPPVIEEASQPMIILKNNHSTLNESQMNSFNIYDYFQVFDEKDKNPTVSFSKESLSKGVNFITIYVVNKFGNTAIETLVVTVNSAPKIEVKESSVTLSIHDKSVDLKSFIEASDEEDGEITTIQMTSNVNIDKEGTYEATYVAVDSLKETSVPVSIEFKVVNQAPVIETEELTFSINQEVNLANEIKVSDFEDDRDGFPLVVEDSMILESTVDLKKEGIYKVKVGNVVDRDGKAAKVKEITVYIKNEAPKIVVPENYELVIDSIFDEEAYLNQVIVTDEEDNKQGLEVLAEVVETNVDTSVEGAYTITVRASDSNGKETIVQGTITVTNEAPVIHGLQDFSITKGATIDLLSGISVTDKEDGVIDSSMITITGTVDTSTFGQYQLLYEVRDSHGKSSGQQSIVVTVLEDTNEEN